MVAFKDPVARDQRARGRHGLKVLVVGAEQVQVIRGAAELLRMAGFRRLAASYGLNELAWGLGTVALAVLVYARTNSPLATTGLFLASTFAPAVLAPAITAAIDRRSRRRALAGLYLGEAFLFAILAVVAATAPLAVVFALAMLDGSLALAGRALTRASVAETLTDAAQLRRGNSLLNVMWSTGSIAGPALGGALVAVAGTGASLLAAGAVFAAMSLLLAHAPLPAGSSRRQGWALVVREGIAHVAGRPALRRLMAAQAGLLVACTLAVPIEVVYAAESLRAGTGAYGLLLAAWGGGMVAGSLIFARAQRTPLRRFMVAALGTIAAGYTVMAAAPTLAIAAVGAGLGGLGNGIAVVAMLQALQERLEERFQARVMSLWEALGAASVGTGYLVGGVLAALTSPRFVFAVAAAGVAAVALAVHRALVQERGQGDVTPVGRRTLSAEELRELQTAAA